MAISLKCSYCGVTLPRGCKWDACEDCAREVALGDAGEREQEAEWHESRRGRG